MLTAKTKVFLVQVLQHNPELAEPIVNFLLLQNDYCSETKFILWISGLTDISVDWDYYLYPGCP